MKTCTHYAILLSLVPLAAGYVPLQMERTQYSSITNQAEHRGTSRATGILGLLIIFEFINLFIHPFLERVTHHSPVLMLLSLVFLASLLIPLHHIMEKWIKEKMTVKNKKILLKNAKKTIEELEEETNNS